MQRCRSLRVSQGEAGLVPCIQALQAEHPFWGDRRIGAHLRFVQQRAVHKQRSLRVMREPHLVGPPNLRLKAKRTPTGRKPKPTKPNEWWGIEMTKVMVAGFGWSYIVVVLDWYTKQVVGYYAGVPCTAKHGLVALDMAVPQPCPEGARGQGISLMSENGCQPTSLAFMEACRTLAIPQAFPSDHNPKGNADTERFMRTLKEECLWRHEWPCPLALASALGLWIDHYNAPYLHSALGYKAPRQFEQAYYTSHSTPFVAA